MARRSRAAAAFLSRSVSHLLGLAPAVIFLREITAGRS
jgi:hypothetical protein